MTATATTTPVPPRPAPATIAGRVTLARVVLSEWTKFRSLRSTVWTMLVAFVLTVGLGALISAVTASQVLAGRADRLTRTDAVTISLAGTTFAQLAIGVLGVLLITGEYSTGMIRASLTAVPKRLPVLWAKLIVFTGVVFPVTLVTAFLSFLLGQALLSRANVSTTLSEPGVLRSVIGSSLYITVAGLIALSAGVLLRSTAASISAFVAVFFVIPPLTLLLPDSWTRHFVQYLPSNAGGSVWGRSEATNALGPWAGFGVLCLYAAVLIVLAAWRMLRTDA